MVAMIRHLRTQHGLPAWAIGRALRVPRSTVSAWLRRLGLNRLSRVPPDLRSTWSHGEVELGECPLVRESHEVSESDRVRFVAEPDTLSKFILGRVDEFMELVPAIDQTLQKMTRR